MLESILQVRKLSFPDGLGLYSPSNISAGHGRTDEQYYISAPVVCEYDNIII